MNKLTRAGITLSTVVSMVVASGTSVQASPSTPAATPSTTVDEPPLSNGWVDIKNVKQLLYIDTHQSSYLHSKIKLLRSIALPTVTGQGYNWAPFGSDKTPFLSIFDGQNHTITGVVVNDAMGGSVGLFGDITGTVRNLRVEDRVTEWRNGSAGGLVGTIIGVSGVSGSIINCHVDGTVRTMAGGSAGGLVGSNFDGAITNSSAMGSVSAIGGKGANVGGLVGSNTNMIESSFAEGIVSGDDGSNAGGLVGESMSGTIKDTYSASAVTAGANSHDGGLIGYMAETEIHSSYSLGPVTKTSGKYSFSGAFSGSNADGLYRAAIYNSFFDDSTAILSKSAGYEGQRDGIGLQGHMDATAESDANMSAKATFTKSGWNFTSIWSISPSVNNGYPYLRQDVPPTWTLPKPLKQTSGKTVPIPKSLPQPKPIPPGHQYMMVINGKMDLGSMTNSNSPFMYNGSIYIPVGALFRDIGGDEKGDWGGSDDYEIVTLPGGKDQWYFQMTSKQMSHYMVCEGTLSEMNGAATGSNTVVVQGLFNGNDICVPADFATSKNGFNLPMKVVTNGNVTTIFIGNPLYIIHFTGPGVYPDGWKAPVLRESWSPALSAHNQAGEFKLFKDELGFDDNGNTYSIDGQHDVIIVGDNGAAGHHAEVQIVLSMWGPDKYDPNWEPGVPHAYRIPVIAEQLFKFYFGKDWKTVWDYYNKNNIPDKFTVNGRTCYASFAQATGQVILDIGYPVSN